MNDCLTAHNVCYNCIWQGIKEIVLLGQNVNSYRDMSSVDVCMPSLQTPSESLSRGFRTVYRPRSGGKRFSDLLRSVAEVNREIRIRFTSPHPKDFPNEVGDVYCIFFIRFSFKLVLVIVSTLSSAFCV